ncbi:hypothetical protein DOY81_002117 [Sarcophaga bullata]|nr:hypothetical protein DOY81_002117 [Sarcophaga bullata]
MVEERANGSERHCILVEQMQELITNDFIFCQLNFVFDPQCNNYGDQIQLELY